MFPSPAGQSRTLLSATPTPCGWLSEGRGYVANALDGMFRIETAPGLQGSPLRPDSGYKWWNNLYNHVLLQAFDGAQGTSVSESSPPEDELRNLCEKGQLDKALDILWRMDKQCTFPSLSLYRVILKACTKRRALLQAKQLHAHLVKRRLETVGCLGEDLVSTLVRCGGLEDAVQVFNRLPQRTVFSWTAVISGYAAVRRGEEALRMYNLMLEGGVEPNRHTILGLIKACRSISDQKCGKRIHADALKYGCGKDLVVGTCLVDMYAKCGSIVDAQNVFDGLSHRDAVSWTAMLSAYVQQGNAEKALQLYVQMLVEGVTPDNRTFVMVLQACGMVAERLRDCVADGPWTRHKVLEMGKSAHANAWRQGYESDVFIGNTLISMYGKCGSIGDAQQVFNVLPKQDVVPWNSMLTAYAQQGAAEEALQLYEQIQEEGVTPDDRTFVSLLQACARLADQEDDVLIDGRLTKVKSFKIGKTVHADICRKGYEADVFVGNTLVSMYSNSGSIVDAQMVFDGLSQRDVVSWNGLVAAHAQQGQPDNALEVFKQMLEEGLIPTVRTYVGVLQACGLLAEREDTFLVDGQVTSADCLSKGKEIHADVWRKGYGYDSFVGNVLVSMYGKCGSIVDAQSVFNELTERNVVAWTALLSGYVQQGQADKALQLYTQMREEGLSADSLAFLSMLQACSLLADKEEEVFNGPAIKVTSLARGRAIHADAWKQGYNLDPFIGSALISMYGKCGSIVDAEIVFDGFLKRSIGTWNAMLSAYVEHAQGGRVLQLYRQMEEEGVSPDEVTLVCVLQACSNAGSLGVCRQVHHSFVAAGKGLTALLANTLIHAFGSCYSMLDAQSVFDALPEPDVVSWTALIAGYAKEGNYAASLQRFKAMQLTGVAPNAVTYLAILSACTHAGSVKTGIEFFESMIRDNGITPQIEHYSSMVDLLGRAGHFTAVQHVLMTMPMQPDLTLWVCLLGACQKHGKVVLGKQAFDGALSLQPKHPAAYVLMSNIYADAGLRERATEVKELRHREGAWKEPGQSWIEHCQETHTFAVEDQKHAQQHELYEMLAEINREYGQQDERGPSAFRLQPSEDPFYRDCNAEGP